MPSMKVSYHRALTNPLAIRKPSVAQVNDLEVEIQTAAIVQD